MKIRTMVLRIALLMALTAPGDIDNQGRDGTLA
jgi:hypothetical protein